MKRGSMSWAESSGKKAGAEQNPPPPQALSYLSIRGTSSAGSWPQCIGAAKFRARSQWSWPLDLMIHSPTMGRGHSSHRTLPWATPGIRSCLQTKCLSLHSQIPRSDTKSCQPLLRSRVTRRPQDGPEMTMPKACGANITQTKRKQNTSCRTVCT